MKSENITKYLNITLTIILIIILILIIINHFSPISKNYYNVIFITLFSGALLLSIYNTYRSFKVVKYLKGNIEMENLLSDVMA